MYSDRHSLTNRFTKETYIGLGSVVDDQNSQIFWHFYEHLGQMNGKMPEKVNISNFWHNPYGFDKP